MPKILAICTYCGHKYSTYIYAIEQELKCEKCNDKNVVKRPPDDYDKDPFGYNKPS